MRWFWFRHGIPTENKLRDMIQPSHLLRCAALSFFLLCACDQAPRETPSETAGAAPPPAEAPSAPAAVPPPAEARAASDAEPSPSVAEPMAEDDEEGPILIEAAKSRQREETETPPARQLDEEEQRRVLDNILQIRAKQQAEGLGTGTVRVNGAWPYSGYSVLSPNPEAAIEARLVAVDVTISGHTPFFDIDDIEIVDGASLVSYGSDPHVEPLRADGRLMGEDEAIPAAPAASRWLLIYAFPKASPRFHLHYWGKPLTSEPVGFGSAGLSLPYPPTE